MIFGSQVALHNNQACFYTGNRRMGSGTLPDITVYEHSSPHNLLMQVEAVSGKEETICQHNPEAPPTSLGCSSLKKGLRQNEKLFCGQMNQNLKFLL